MLIRPVDRALDEDEWRAFLADHDFGQLIVPTGDGLPIVVPTHFVFDPSDELLFHLATENPACAALGTGREVLFTIIGAYAYVPTTWNASPGTDVRYGIPTSYYATVQLAGHASLTEDPDDLAAILTRQLAHFQPEGGHAPIEPGNQPYGRALANIRGVRLAVRWAQAKFKFGGNKSAAHRLSIAERLQDRGRPLDLEARDHLLRRLQAMDPGSPDGA